MDCFVVSLLAMTKETRDSTPHTVIARTEGSWQSQYGIQLFIHGILFLFCFCINFLWFMDCFVVSLLAMTKNGDEGLLFYSQWQMGQRVVFTNSSLRGLEKPVAISVWQPPYSTHTIIARITFAIRGNFGMEYYDSQTKLVIARTEGSWQSINL